MPPDLSIAREYKRRVESAFDGRVAKMVLFGSRVVCWRWLGRWDDELPEIIAHTAYYAMYHAAVALFPERGVHCRRPMPA